LEEQITIGVSGDNPTQLAGEAGRGMSSGSPGSPDRTRRDPAYDGSGRLNPFIHQTARQGN